MKSIVDEISIVSQMDPQRPAIVSDGIEVTYQRLDASIRRTESWLLNEGVRTWQVGAMDFKKLGAPDQSDLVMVTAEDPIDFVICELAALDMGLQVMPVPPRVSSNTKREMIRKLHPGRVLRKAPIGVKPLIERPAFQTGKLIDITSGSTGAKKLVDRHIENLNDEAQAVAKAIDIHHGTKVLVATPLAHSFGGGMMRATLSAGGTLYVPGGPYDGVAPLVIQIKRMLSDVDIVTGVPFTFRMLSRSWTGKRLPFLRAYAGGEVLPDTLADQWRVRTGSSLMQEYGLSEGGICTFEYFSPVFHSVGRPIPGVRFTVEDDELIVYRPWAPKRYHFGESPKTFRSDGGIHTGDLGRVDSDGRIYLTGRKKSVVIVAGMKVVPAEIERVLTSHPQIDEAVVFGEQDYSMRGERLVALVTTTVNQLDTSGVMRFVKERLESYKVPRQLIVVKEFPRTVSGKIDRGVLMPQPSGTDRR